MEHSNSHIWGTPRLWKLVWPLVIEQILLTSMGMIDTFMVGTINDKAVNGIGIVDPINILMVTIISSLIIGGSVVVIQYAGKKQTEKTAESSRLLLQNIFLISVSISIFCLVLGKSMLHLIYGTVESDVMESAQLYFALSALSYPFMALYSVGSILFRSVGNTQKGMILSFIAMVINLLGSSILIFGLHWGVAGAATSTLISRIITAAIALWLLQKPQSPLYQVQLLQFKSSPELSRRINRMGLPNALEASTFQVGKIFISRIAVSFGTSAFAGYAMASNLVILRNIIGTAIGLALMIVAGQCIGAGDIEGAKNNTRTLMRAGTLSAIITGGLVVLLSRPLLNHLNLSQEASQFAFLAVVVYCVIGAFIWQHSYILPNALRAAGEAKYILGVSAISMWVFRVGGAYLLGYVFHFGIMGVWAAMILDWFVKGIAFGIRWNKGQWQSKNLIN